MTAATYLPLSLLLGHRASWWNPWEEMFTPYQNVCHFGGILRDEYFGVKLA
jgi:hypothetical protein